ncbi:transglutaminase-like cysteine peptidase [Aurantimonas sp. A2-1-M11]|uniref:transglutaminase-like cysteine peptidase n=1 Tax=Aurantimonas sp. A2-1-M11 TaxID=3113712 RepID=UPI002F927C1E
MTTGYIGTPSVSKSPSGAARSLMQTGGHAFAPPAFYEFCKREKRLCDSQSGAKIVDLTPSLERELKWVNLAVNRQIRQRDDREATGKDDDWRLPSSREGDCEDFVILKKKELLERGWPASALLITVARQRRNNEGHTVLTVRTSEGDLILDNLTGSVKVWSATPYRYFARQSQRETGKWERIS